MPNLDELVNREGVRPAFGVLCAYLGEEAREALLDDPKAEEALQRAILTFLSWERRDRESTLQLPERLALTLRRVK